MWAQKLMFPDLVGISTAILLDNDLVESAPHRSPASRMSSVSNKQDLERRVVAATDLETSLKTLRGNYMTTTVELVIDIQINRSFRAEDTKIQLYQSTMLSIERKG
ncbi:hypothetical protein RRG08_021197 [Elysia crispata]|uniref:Uncharacterized protein n=1 Tax=Elysia crispata TaxID=231223 RepID=A0AAE0YNW1_9GAST|nr:hypothetical protein RRG08_021197 [Elysia crispata]